MGFAQLYYTSCEQGLDGRPGYQFNAATPGVDPRVLREVERFTTYEPPGTALLEDVAGHPVNLCYSPDLGGAAVLSRVVSVGTDPSGRPGNYFAHSLVRVDDPHGVGPLPAELWGARFWEQAPVTRTDLPVLRVPRAPVDRTDTGRWLRRAGLRRSQLVRLLGAVDAAIDGDRPVLLVADSAAVARCVALMCHLLGPERARALSFATYCGRPDTASVHVVGVPPGFDVHGLHGRFVVFALGAEGPDTLPEVDGDHRVLVRHLVDLGPEQAPHLWRRLSLCSSGKERSLTDWWPVLVAVSLLEEPGAVPFEHLATVHGWLVDAEWLPVDLTVALLARMVESHGKSLTHGMLADLQRVAHRTGSEETITLVEEQIVSRFLQAIACGAKVPPVVPMRSTAVRQAARERVGSLLNPSGSAVGPRRAAALLRWAQDGGVGVFEADLERYGSHTVTGELLRLPPGAVPEADTFWLVEQYDGVRRGVVAALSALPAERVESLVTGPVGALLVRERGGMGVRLCELRRLAEGPGPDPAGLLRELITVRRKARSENPPGLPPYDVDEDLLTGVWGHRPGPAAAERTLARLSTGDRICPGALEWITRALVEVPAPAQAGAWQALAAAVAEHWLCPELPQPAGRVLAEWAVARVALEQVRTGGEKGGATSLAAVYRRAVRAHPAVRAAVHRRGAELLLTWRTPNLMAQVLRECPPGLFDVYIDRAGEELVREHPDTALAALVLAVAFTPAWEQGRHERVRALEHKVVLPALLRWNRRSVVAVRKQLRVGAAERFEALRKGVRGPRARRKWRGGRTG